ncbi:nitrate/nitrite transporter [Paracraurococcus lichenis]|uniref:Nitrate/nitrite transporter n=1 Tax=Paracraurococcus lichenis TaxID=3064888 RepID=A0ABT9E8X4_9PROT|nr:nitrate/nitrite transporter [Paracraurococcus sp. LOR1-02]MDO9712638.1 nitrate/nitrite transporter [Paracraurococcus sp. LOR1-02]
MVSKDFLKAGHPPTLFAAFFYFDMSFMVWVMLGPLGVQIAQDLHLDAAQRGLMVAVPLLSGALLRVVNGVLVDRIGPLRTGMIGQVVVILGLLVAWWFGVHGFAEVLALGVVLGLAGASFAVALPLASRWYPPDMQGIALGIAGAGNSGVVFAALFAPGLAAAYGWTNVLGLAALPLAVAFATYLLLARESPERPPPKSLAEYMAVFRTGDAWWFMFFYAVTFGGFSGLASSLPIYFHDQYGLDPKLAGYFAAACVFAGSLVRPVGGTLADRIGGIRALSVMYATAASAIAIVSFGLPQAWMALTVFILGMLAFGMGNGAVFQLVPQRFRREIGVMTGLVGMTGGIGGFWLASSLGYSRQLTGSYQAGLLVFAVLAALALVGLSGIKARWRTTWGAVAGLGRI